MRTDLDHGRIVWCVAIHEDPGTGDWDGGEGANMVDDTNTVAIELGVVDNSPKQNTINSAVFFYTEN